MEITKKIDVFQGLFSYENLEIRCSGEKSIIMNTETITLTLTAGIAIFVFSTMLYNYLKKSQGQISTIEDTLGNVVNSTRSMYESVLSSNERANSMDILYQEGHRKMLNDHSTIVQQVPPTLTELQQNQETIAFDIERMQRHMEQLQQNSVTKDESKDMANHLNAHRHQHQNDMTRLDADNLSMRDSLRTLEDMTNKIGEAMIQIIERVNQQEQTNQSNHQTIMRKLTEDY